MSELTARQRFDRELGRLLGSARRRAALHGALSVAATAAGLLGAAAWALGGTDEPPVVARAGLLLGGAVLLLAVIEARLVRPLRRLRDRAALAGELERGGDLRNLLVAAEEAGRRPARWSGAVGVAAALVERLYVAAAGVAATLKLGRRLPLPGVWLAPLGAAGVAALLFWGAAAEPGRLGAGLTRLGHPLRGDLPPPEAGLYLAPGPPEVVAGTDAIVAARDFGRPRGEVRCEVRAGRGLWRPVACAASRASSDAPYVLWTATLPAVKESFAYRFLRDGMTTPEGTVRVLHPPLLVAWGGAVVPPAYTRLPAQFVPRLPAHLQAPVGSRLAWTGVTGGDVVTAAVVSAVGDSVPLAAVGDTLRGAVVLHAPLAYTVCLRDRRGLENESRVAYLVSIVPDADPSATLVRPGADERLPGEGAVALLAGASDDYGLIRLDLLLRRESALASAGPATSEPSTADEDWSRVTVWPQPAAPAIGGAPSALGLATPWGSAAVTPGAATGPPPAGPLALALALDATGLDLLPGDALAVCLEAFDNRLPGPPGRGRSPVLRLVLPSAAEILAEQVGGGEERVEALEELRRRSEQLAGDLERLDLQLKKDPQPGWERQQELQSALERQRSLQEEFRKVTADFQDDLARLARDNLNSVELLQKMEEVAALLEEVHSAELDDLLAQLRERAAGLSPEQLRQAIEEVARDQEEYRARLDRAIGLLREMAREQEMEGLTSVVGRLIREQQALLDAARADSVGGAGSRERESAAESHERAQRQAALAEEARRLAERMREALARLEREQRDKPSPSAESMRQALEQALARLDERQPDASMQEAARRLERRPSPGSPPQESQRQAVRELAALYNVLLKGQLNMQAAMQQFATVSLRRLAADLLALSAREEEIADVIPGELRGVSLGDLTRRQHRVARAAREVRNRLQGVGSRTPAVSQRLLRGMDDAISALDATAGDLERGIGPTARRGARSSLEQINRIVIGLLTSAQMASSGGGSGTPMPSASEQLQQMAREQAGLNGFADELRRQLQQRGPSQEARSRMERLQADQSGLAGRLEDLARREREAPPGERVLGDLERLAQEMERVADDLGAGRLDDGTLARQERILSRLLDAHNSVRKRDFTQRRESRSARIPLAPQTGERRVSGAPDAEDPLRLRRESIEKAPPDYRDLVRRYFEAVERLLPAPPPAAPGAGATRGERP